MALQDILNAIIAETDRRLDEARALHNKEMSALKEEHRSSVTRRKQDIVASKEKKQAMLLAKAKAHAEAGQRNALLKTKQDLLDDLYQAVLDHLSSLSSADAEPILQACLDRIASEGTLYPAKKHEEVLKKLAASKSISVGDAIECKGGFRFESNTQEEDCTFESLVQNYLRPQTELSSAHTLFLSA